MRKILIIAFALFLSTFASAEVSVMQGVKPEKKKEQPIYPTPANLEIDDEMLPTSTDYYLVEACTVGKQPVYVQTAQQQKPPQKGAKAAAPSYKIKEYKTVSACHDYTAADTPLERQRVRYAAQNDFRHIPNRGPITINTKAYLGNPYGVFIVKGKAVMPYAIPYDTMKNGSVLKKILTDQTKIAKFYSFNLLASNNLGFVMQKRFNRNLPIRISFYEEKVNKNESRTFVVFVFNEAEKYTYRPAPLEKLSDTVYGITPDYVVQYIGDN